MLTTSERRVFDHLAQFVTDHKKQVIRRVLDHRTRYITVVLEDIFQSQNASAVIRTCECMGLQEVHIVENITKYSINPRVLKGANKWMSIQKHASQKENNTVTCVSALKESGYSVLALDPDADGQSILDFDITSSKVALIFGNELRGLSPTALEQCDAKVRIPMYGFTESLNISVSVAICLSTLVSRMHESGIDAGLSNDEKDVIRLAWYRKIVRNSGVIEREFLRAIE
ncbi:MAG TPA: RNA methyltransferase [Chryseolinea sp.]|nr:RNA methyltransferase [Chryseolinea sp.]